MNCSQTQGTPNQGHNMMASQSSQLNCSQPRSTPGQGFIGFQTHCTPNQVVTSQSSQLNCSQTQCTPSQQHMMASQLYCSQPRNTPGQQSQGQPMTSQPFQLNRSQLQGTPSQGPVMASQQSFQPRSTPGPGQLNGQGTSEEAQQPSMQIQQHPSVIRCQLITPSQIPRAAVPGTPIFATPSTNQYLQSQNATQSRSTPEEEEYEASRVEKNYKTMTDAGCIQLLASSIDSILKDTCNNAFRQEIFQLLEVETSDDAAKIFKEKLSALCAKE